MSTTFGRVSDFDEVIGDVDGSKANGEPLDSLKPSIPFYRHEAGPPKQEPWFGTYYWIQDLDPSLIQRWKDLSCPLLPPKDSLLSLPPRNPFVPSNFDIKPTPLEDSDHPLLNCSLKLSIPVGKQKVGRVRRLASRTNTCGTHLLISCCLFQQWLPGTVTKFNSIKNQILISYEDEDEKWHLVDKDAADLSRTCGLEGTLDGKKIKFKVVAVPKDGEGAIRKYGDESDDNVLQGIQFPAIPPAKSPSHLPQLVRNNKVGICLAELS